MQRGSVPVVVAVVVAVVVVWASAAGPGRLWDSPQGDRVDAPSVAEPEESAPSRPAPSTRAPSGRDGWDDVVAAVAVVAGVAFALWTWPGVRRPTVRERFVRRPLASPAEPLPAVPTTRRLGAGAPRTRSPDGTDGVARNDIVASWMAVERAAAGRGLARTGAETSAEFCERLVGARAVDPTNVRELAALYREARFSRHALHPATRDRAADLRTALAAQLVSDGVVGREVPA